MGDLPACRRAASLRRCPIATPSLSVGLTIDREQSKRSQLSAQGIRSSSRPTSRHASISPINCGMTRPRLSSFPSGSRSIRCQLIRARQRPASLTASHVPPSGSRG